MGNPGAIHLEGPTTMKHFTISLALALTLSLKTSVAADPYCVALSDPEQLPKNYAKRGPFHVDALSGWIVGQDQLKAKFAVTHETAALWKAIAEGFEAKDVKLVVLAAPPRPLFAPKDALPDGYSATSAEKAFSAYISALNTTGITAPDLTVLRETPFAPDFYFARDTHWTPAGAAVSAAHLSEAMTGRQASDIVADVVFNEQYSEKGSLSTVVEKTCGTRPEAELVKAPVYTQKGDATALLSDVKDVAAALVGTSFSDRYKRDAYQVSGALSLALEKTVDNFSVTGGGMTGAMEAFLRSDALASGRYDTVIWEVPYTAPLTNISGLRQILGILQEDGVATAVYHGPINADWLNIDHEFFAADFTALRLHTPGMTKGKLSLELYAANGQKMRANLVKSDRVAADARSDTWSLSLAALPIQDVKRLKVRLANGGEQISIDLIR